MVNFKPGTSKKINGSCKIMIDVGFTLDERHSAKMNCKFNSAHLKFFKSVKNHGALFAQNLKHYVK